MGGDFFPPVDWSRVDLPNNEQPINDLQQEQLRERADQASNAIVLGDLNEAYRDDPPNGEMSRGRAVERWSDYTVVDAGPTIEKGFYSGRQIDHVILGEDVAGAQTAEAETFNPRVPGGGRASDHKGVYVEFVPERPESNQPPVAQMNLPNQVRIGESVTLDAGPSYDPDGRIRNYGWRIRPSGDFDGQRPDVIRKTGRTVEVALDTPGEYNVALVVFDDDKARDQETRTLRVTEAADLTVNVDGPSQVQKNDAFTLTAQVDGDSRRVENYRWSVRPEGQGRTRRGSGRTFGLSLSAPGTYDVLLFVRTTDGDVIQARQSLTVSPIGVTPTVSIEGRDEIGKNETVTYTANLDDADVSGAEFRWRFAPDGSATGMTGSGREFVVSPTQPGPHEVSVRVDLPSGGDAEDVMDVTVAPIDVNQSPEAEIEIVGGSREVTKNKPVTLSGASSTDPDGGITSYFWSAYNADNRDRAGSGSGERFVFQTSEPGTYTVRLTVEDADGESDTAQVRIVVKPF